MSKRFTATEKWADPWFQDLSPEYKVLWQYVTDQCDQAGVWVLNRKMAEFSIGAPLDWSAAFEAFAGRVVLIDNGRKWWVRRFVEFQYGRLSRDCKPHLPIIALLEKHGIPMADVPQAEGPGKTHNVSPETRARVFARDGYECAYCGKEKDPAFLVVDHVVPRKKGGDDKPGNLVAACVPCNSKKSDHLLEDFCNRYTLDFQTLSQRVSDRVCKTLLEKEKEKEKEKKKEKETDQDGERGSGKGDRARNPVWDCLCEVFGLQPVTKSEKTRLGRMVREFTEKGAIPEEIRLRGSRYRQRWAGAAFTPEALFKHWDTMGQSTGTGINGASVDKAAIQATMDKVLREESDGF